MTVVYTWPTWRTFRSQARKNPKKPTLEKQEFFLYFSKNIFFLYFREWNFLGPSLKNFLYFFKHIFHEGTSHT